LGIESPSRTLHRQAASELAGTTEVLVSATDGRDVTRVCQLAPLLANCACNGWAISPHWGLRDQAGLGWRGLKIRKNRDPRPGLPRSQARLACESLARKRLPGAVVPAAGRLCPVVLLFKKPA